MPNHNLPVKASVSARTASLLAQHQQIREDKTALLVDPLMRLAEAMPLLGCPSYAVFMKSSAQFSAQ